MDTKREDNQNANMLLNIKNEIKNKLLSEINNISYLSDLDLLDLITKYSLTLFINTPFTLAERKGLIESVYNSLRGYDVIQNLMDDPSVTEIMINDYDKIFYEREGKLFKSEIQFDNRSHLLSFINYYFSKANRPLTISKPISDLSLDDGSRAHAVIPPASVDSPVMNIRKFTGIRPSAENLINNGSISKEAVDYLKQAVEQKKSIFISGGTGSGKTTLLNILTSFIPKNERIITIEDAAELQVQGINNLVRLEAQTNDTRNSQGIKISSLLRAALRMRPDRIIVGEIRGEESVELLNAMNTGHPGSLSTGHANSCLDMLNRLSNLIQSYSDMPYENIRQNLASGIDIMVHLSRRSDGHRQVTEIIEIESYQEQKFIYKIKFSLFGGKLCIIN